MEDRLRTWELLRPCVGPALRSSFAEWLETEDEPTLAEAIRLYRERYAPVGMFENLAELCEAILAQSSS